MRPGTVGQLVLPKLGAVGHNITEESMKVKNQPLSLSPQLIWQIKTFIPGCQNGSFFTQLRRNISLFCKYFRFCFVEKAKV